MAGLTCEVNPNETYHVHTHLSVFLDGQQIAVPGQIGIVAQPAGGHCFYQLHTHDKSGKLHVEAPAPGEFTLGQIFDLWGQPLQGELRMGVIPTIAPFLLPAMLPRLRSEWPKLKLFLREETSQAACDALHRGQLDCVLLATPYACGEIDKAILFDDRLFVAFPKGEAPPGPTVELMYSTAGSARMMRDWQDPTKAASNVPGSTALPNDLMRPYAGYNNIRMWDYSGFSNYNALQAGVTRRFDKNYMYSVFYVWSKALTINNDDFSAGWPFTTDDATIRHYDYSYAASDRPHNFVLNAIYRTPHVKDGVAGMVTNDWQISGVYRYASGRPYGIGFSIPNISSINLTGSDFGARVVVTCNPGSGSSSDPYKQIDTSCFAPPQPGSKGDESARYFLHGPAQNNVDLSLSKQFALYKSAKFEFRIDAFNALNHTQFTGVNATANFASLTDHTITNLPYDASGKLVNKNGFGTINGVNIPRTLQLVTRVTF